MIQSVKTANGVDYEDTDRGRVYSRLVTGIGWPGAKPGAAVVVAEQARYTVGSRCEYHVLRGIEVPRLRDLLNRTISEIVVPFRTSKVVGFLDLGPHVQYLRWWNRERRQKGMDQLRVSPAPHSDGDGISFHLELLRGLMCPGSVKLYFERGSFLPGRLQELSEDPVKLTAPEYPAAAALGYAVAYCMLYPLRQERGGLVGNGPRQTHESSQYDPLRHGLGRRQ